MNNSVTVKQQYATGRNLVQRCSFHERFSENAYGWFRWVFDQYAFGDNAAIIEVGCGTGALWSACRERVPPSWSLVLTDISPGMVREASEALRHLNCRLSTCVCDAQMLPVAPACADVVIANHMLYHVPDLSATLCEIARALKPRGQFHATTVGADHLKEIGELVAPFLDDPDHWRRIMPRQFLLETAATSLADAFTDIEGRDYVDAFVVTEAEPLLNYILSMPLRGTLEAKADALLQHLESEIGKHDGAIRITKATGMISARRRQIAPCPDGWAQRLKTDTIARPETESEDTG